MFASGKRGDDNPKTPYISSNKDNLTINNNRCWDAPPTIEILP